MPHTSVSLRSHPDRELTPVQLAGNKDPFTVTVILACVQLLSVLISAVTTDTVGRRPLTVYGYAVTVVSVLCLGIVGCFDYATPKLGSLLVSHMIRQTGSTLTSDLLCVPRDILYHRGECHRLRIPRRDSTTTYPSPDCRIITRFIKSLWYPLQFHNSSHAQWTGQQRGLESQDCFLVS